MELAFRQMSYGDPKEAIGWKIRNKYGLIFCFYEDDETEKFPCPLGSSDVARIAWKFLSIIYL